jgi:hypothetical protein
MPARPIRLNIGYLVTSLLQADAAIRQIERKVPFCPELIADIAVPDKIAGSLIARCDIPLLNVKETDF